jgi:hypothetical protein
VFSSAVISASVLFCKGEVFQLIFILGRESVAGWIIPVFLKGHCVFWKLFKVCCIVTMLL